MKEIKKQIRKILLEEAGNNQIKKIIKALKQDEIFEIIDETAAEGSTPMQGACWIVADALNIAFGWPLFVIFNHFTNHLDHFVVQVGDNQFLDARSLKTMQQVLQENAEEWAYGPIKVTAREMSLVKYSPELDKFNHSIVRDLGASHKIAQYLKNQINEGFFDVFKKKKEIFQQHPDIWTHATNSEELIKHLMNGGDFIGKNEDLSKFNIPKKGAFATFINQHSPNFKKGSFFSGFELHNYLITTDLPDDAFQPNWNSRNYKNFDDSQNVGVLKPNFRNSNFFKLWKRNDDGKFELIK